MNRLFKTHSFSFLAASLVALMTLKPALGAPNLQAQDSAEGVAAAEALAQSKSSSSEETLLTGLAMGLSPKVTVAALKALAQKGSPKAVDTLLFYTQHRHPDVRLAALGALAATNNKQHASVFVEALSDKNTDIRQLAAEEVTKRETKAAMPTLINLLKKGDKQAGVALAAMADGKTADDLVALKGAAPDALLATTLGSILMRKEFGPEKKRIELLLGLGKIPGPTTIEQLSNYVEAIPEKPFRESRKQADILLKQRLGQ